ncbi:unnamed protein product [Coffea canephora]|uniref:Uncharacterized protein n=1 Tax=Coffea canephora TaxID=49390 RepID=A0A068TWY5_COFCA|nr:unnamed protein product [Coffea canephora]
MCSSPFFQSYQKAQKRGPKYRDQHHFIRQKYPYTFCLVTGSPYPPDLFRLDSRSKLPHSIRPYRRRNQPSASLRAPFPTPTIKVWSCFNYGGVRFHLRLVEARKEEGSRVGCIWKWHC